jgi:hypothetical protein
MEMVSNERKNKIKRANQVKRRFFTHEAGGVGGVCSHFVVDLDQPLLDD